jgi:hypothetical protein
LLYAPDTKKLAAVDEPTASEVRQVDLPDDGQGNQGREYQISGAQARTDL